MGLATGASHPHNRVGRLLPPHRNRRLALCLSLKSAPYQTRGHRESHTVEIMSGASSPQLCGSRSAEEKAPQKPVRYNVNTFCLLRVGGGVSRVQPQ